MIDLFLTVEKKKIIIIIELYIIESHNENSFQTDSRSVDQFSSPRETLVTWNRTVQRLTSCVYRAKPMFTVKWLFLNSISNQDNYWEEINTIDSLVVECLHKLIKPSIFLRIPEVMCLLFWTVRLTTKYISWENR